MYNIWEGTTRLKCRRAKKIQNLVHFSTTFNFDRKYFKNWSRCQKQKTNLNDNDPWGFSKKIGKLWSCNKKVIGADSHTGNGEYGAQDPP